MPEFLVQPVGQSRQAHGILDTSNVASHRWAVSALATVTDSMTGPER
jgi:hypothetical protein